MRSEERVRSQKYFESGTPPVLPEVDLLIAGATWDRRCVELIRFEWSTHPERTVLVKYSDKGTSGRVERHEALLSEFLRTPARADYSEIAITAKEVNQSWEAARGALIAAYRAASRPLRVAIDLNSVPRFISLGLIGLGSRSGIISECYAFYSTTSGYTSHDASASEGFTVGEWLPVAVATLSSGAPPNSTSHLVVSAGFEGLSTRRLVNALEPDRVSVALSVGISDANDRKARKANTGLAEEYMLGDSAIVACDILDVAGTVMKLQSIAQPAFREAGPPEYTSFLLCGTKPVSLAVALVALDSPIAHVYYPSPQAHVENDVVDVTGTLIVQVSL